MSIPEAVRLRFWGGRRVCTGMSQNHTSVPLIAWIIVVYVQLNRKTPMLLYKLGESDTPWTRELAESSSNLRSEVGCAPFPDACKEMPKEKQDAIAARPYAELTILSYVSG